jgi:glycosyltransferase involved in cell wall biosynthesis
MRIGFVSRYPPVHCGIAEYTKMLISSMFSLNLKVDVCVLATDEVHSDSYSDDLGIDVYPCYKRFEKNYSNLLNVLAEIGGVDVLHVQHEYGIFGAERRLIDALLEAKSEKLAKKAIITMHTVDHPYSERSDETIVFQSWLNELDAIVVHSNLQEFELQNQGLNPSEIYRIPHGTLINPYLYLTRRILSRSIGIDDNFKGVILTVPGFLRRDKGVEVLLDALRMLKDLTFTLIIAGEPRDEDLKATVESSEFRTILIERYLSSDEILRVVALADAIILPYKDRKGAYAVSGILHLSMGGLKPVVGSRTPRLVELYQHAPKLTVPPNNPVELAKKIEWLVANYDYALAYMAEVYSYAARTQWIRVAHRHLELYRTILS